MQRIHSPPSAAVGQILKGAKASYRLTERLNTPAAPSTLFKAAVVSSTWTSNSSTPSPIQPRSPEQVVVKFPLPDNWPSFLHFKREYNAYRLPSIASAPDIRKMVDLIGNPEDFTDHHCPNPPALVLEWFDSTLQHLDHKVYGKDLKLVSATVKVILRVLEMFAKEGKVHSGKCRAVPLVVVL